MRDETKGNAWTFFKIVVLYSIAQSFWHTFGLIAIVPVAIFGWLAFSGSKDENTDDNTDDKNELEEGGGV